MSYLIQLPLIKFRISENLDIWNSELVDDLWKSRIKFKAQKKQKNRYFHHRNSYIPKVPKFRISEDLRFYEFEKKNHKYEVLNGQFLYKHNVEIPKNTDIEEINEQFLISSKSIGIIQKRILEKASNIQSKIEEKLTRHQYAYEMESEYVLEYDVKKKLKKAKMLIEDDEQEYKNALSYVWGIQEFLVDEDVFYYDLKPEDFDDVVEDITHIWKVLITLDHKQLGLYNEISKANFIDYLRKFQHKMNDKFRWLDEERINLRIRIFEDEELTPSSTQESGIEAQKDKDEISVYSIQLSEMKISQNESNQEQDEKKEEKNEAQQVIELKKILSRENRRKQDLKTTLSQSRSSQQQKNYKLKDK